MTVESIADLRAALQQAETELAFEAGRQAATDPERAEHLMAANSTTGALAGSGACGVDASAVMSPPLANGERMAVDHTVRPVKYRPSHGERVDQPFTDSSETWHMQVQPACAASDAGSS
ncbi:hypothetical protein [Streptomyces sp. NPDC051994]|uniref:hypothetical protein n=1 Tax=unclassified Streptomyces TaxID=2593676 RepID=UPI00343FD9E9